MDENLQKLISKLSNRYLAGSLIELQDTISDEWKPSDSQLYYVVAVCQKTIEELDANPPKIKDYYSCSIVGTRGPKDFLICTLEVIDEAFEEHLSWELSSEEQELFSTALRIVSKHLGLALYLEDAITTC